ncbi:transmembrane protein 95 isoform X4 [Mastomys coucha]|uniref:transmembrane protein 95 isoform X4 n=1 Tax=Mastomys coucha TaxID=35658 RepID=UPI001262A608|nr:transmembrane protein 95 isoform X4 [Mastomys coucha]
MKGQNPNLREFRIFPGLQGPTPPNPQQASYHDLPNRLAQLKSRMKPQWKEWASPDFSAFALDEMSMKQITEKTHRVLRVIEKKRSISVLPLYWRWLQRTKIPQYTREGGHDLWEAKILLLCIFGIVLLLGILSLQVEYLKLQAKDL